MVAVAATSVALAMVFGGRRTASVGGGARPPLAPYPPRPDPAGTDGGATTASAAATRRGRRRLIGVVRARRRAPRSDSPRPVAPDERVVFFPTASRRVSDDDGSEGWEVPIHGWIFQPEERSLKRRALINLLRSALDLDKDSGGRDGGDDRLEIGGEIEGILPSAAAGGEVKRLSTEILSRRLRPFIVCNKRRRSVTVQIGTRAYPLGGLSAKNGHFESVLRLTDDEVGAAAATGGVLRFVTPAGRAEDGDIRVFGGRSRLLGPAGLSVISDIDDTVKISKVGDTKELLRRSFLEEFAAVPGMARLYRAWAAERGAAFHYVSSSPWQLYEELASFFDRTGFPEAAALHLKSVRLKERRSLLGLLADPTKSKIRAIEGILGRYPRRDFVLVGDTGERDPEVYGEIARRHPGRIVRIFLRDVTEEGDECAVTCLVKDGDETSEEECYPPVEECKMQTRMETAFLDVDTDVWSLFTEAAEIVLPPS